MKHFGENTLLFASSDWFDPYALRKAPREFRSNIGWVLPDKDGAPYVGGAPIFRIVQYGRNYRLFVYEELEINSSGLLSPKLTKNLWACDARKAMEVAKLLYLEMDLPEGSYYFEKQHRVWKKGKKTEKFQVRTIYESVLSYNEYSEYAGLKASWE